MIGVRKPGVKVPNAMWSSPISRVSLLVIAATCALGLVALQAWPQNQILGTRDEVALTEAQQSVVNRITAAPGSGNVNNEFSQRLLARLVLPLADGSEIRLASTRPLLSAERGLTWRGIIEETGERAILMLRRDGHLSGYFAYQGHVFRVALVDGQIQTMAAIEPPDHTPNPEASSWEGVTPRRAPPEPQVQPLAEPERQALEARMISIDLMLLYTKNAVSDYLGEPAGLIADAVEEANQTFARSGIGNISLRLVHTELVDYEEAGQQHFDILYAMVDGVGGFRQVNKLRNQKRADIVGLIVNSPSGCGLSTRVGADAEEAFFVVHHACAANMYAIAHEVGHLIGARHDRLTDGNNRPFPYAHGYVNGTKWRDIMSYRESCGNCPRIPYWSNPRVLYKGEPTGTTASDNARVILEQAERVSKFRQ
jgi:Metallo-peptidase family M12